LGRENDWGMERRKGARKWKWREGKESGREGRGKEKKGREGQTPPEQKFWPRP